MSTFSFIIAILMAIMGDSGSEGVGLILLIATGIFSIAGFVLLWRGE